MAKSLIIKIDGDDSCLRTKLNALGGVANTTLKAVSVGRTAVTGALSTATTAGMVYNSQMISIHATPKGCDPLKY